MGKNKDDKLMEEFFLQVSQTDEFHTEIKLLDEDQKSIALVVHAGKTQFS